MKDIRNLKIWPSLEKEGFKTIEHRTGGIIFGRGAVLPNASSLPRIEVKPMVNGKWLLEVYSLNSATEWTCNPFELSELLPKQIDKLKNMGKPVPQSE